MNQTIYINARFLTQNITGVQRYAHELTATLDRMATMGDQEAAGVRFILLAPQGELLFRPEYSRLELRQAGRFSGHLWEQLSLPFFSSDGLLFCPGNTAPLLSLVTGKVVTTVHDLSFRSFPEAYSTFFRLTYRILTPAIMRWSHNIITVSQSEKENISSIYSRLGMRLIVIQNGGLADVILQEQVKRKNHLRKIKETQPYVLYVGALNKRKNIHGIIAAAARFALKGLAMKIIGDTAKALQGVDGIPVGKESNIEFLGQVNDIETLLLHLRGAACFLFPSFYEASSIPPLEAMACGCPVVCSDIPALRERCGDAALYCDPHDPADIASKAIQAATDEATRSSLIEKGLRRAQLFTWESCARKTLAVLRAAAKRR